MKIILVPRAFCSLSRRCLNTRTRRSSGSRAQGSSGLAGSGNRTRMDENSSAKEGRCNLSPRVVSYLSPSRSKGRVGRNSGNEVGREGENGRDFAPLFSYAPLRFVTSHSRVTRVSRSRLLKKRGALGEAEKEVFRAFFTRTYNIFFFPFQENSSGPLILHYRAVDVKSWIIGQCMVSETE